MVLWVGSRITTRNHVVTVDYDRLLSHSGTPIVIMSVVIVVVQVGVVDIICRKREINILQALTEGRVTNQHIAHHQ